MGTLSCFAVAPLNAWVAYSDIWRFNWITEKGKRNDGKKKKKKNLKQTEGV